jgi:8-oxo-dGTP pyrophosphatase MutT (NUDIX family)
MTLTSYCSSLAGDYLVILDTENDTTGCSMHLESLTATHDTRSLRHVGAYAWDMLHRTPTPASSVLCLSCRVHINDSIQLSANQEIRTTVPVDLLDLLCKILVQYTLQNHPHVHCSSSITWMDGTPSQVNTTTNDTLALARNLFTISDDDCAMELVDMVDCHGHVLGHVPRTLVHRHNILHRGVGVFVVAQPSDFVTHRSPLYCHQRSPTKRIFPSLYDMFVGGVSLANEDAVTTARREVMEELGFMRGTLLPDKLLQCTVCTSYNRCVVDLYVYTVHAEETTAATWQPEEVAWGDWVPYAVVAAAADLSMQRLAERNEWPGRYHPPLQSLYQGQVPPDTTKYAVETWDFVPDGLLVWEAWLEHTAQQGSTTI